LLLEFSYCICLIAKFAYFQDIAVLASLSHPNLLTMYGTVGDEPTLVTQLADLGSLSGFLEKLRAGKLESSVMLPLSLQVALAAGISNGLAFLHGAPRGSLLHGDMKPANVLLLAGLRPVLCDFGCAQMMCKTPITLAPNWIGLGVFTVRYCAPEQHNVAYKPPRGAVKVSP
jgi:serine/threonine protein kinase